MMKKSWRNMTIEERFMELAEKTNEIISNLTSYERDCMMSTHLSEMHGQPVDQVAKRIIDEVFLSANQAWKKELLGRENN